MKTSAGLLLNAMTPEAAKLRAENNLKALPEQLQKRVQWIINAGMDDAQSTVRIMTGTADDLRVLEVALDLEKAGMDRKTRLDLIKRTSAKFTKVEETTPVEILSADSLLDGTPNTALSPMEAGALAQVETGWQEARRLADLVKNYSRATTAAKTLCGIRLRALRVHYFGPRTGKAGRLKKIGNVSDFSSWSSMLADKVGVEERTANNWMQMADAVEALAEAKGLDLQGICEKLPWDWTPEEAAALDATVQKLTQDKTQRELLQSDFLSSLGYTAPERINSSPNQLGINGGKKKKPATMAERIEGRRILARTEIFGQDKRSEDGTHMAAEGSPAFWMAHFTAQVLDCETPGDDTDTPFEALTSRERTMIFEGWIKPFLDAWKKLEKRSPR